MDLLPTLLGLAGLPAPAPLDGVDLAPLLTERGSLAPRTLFFHYPHRRATAALRHGDEKLVLAWSSGTSELYDLAADPGEAQDLAGERPQRVRELESELRAWLTSVEADVRAPGSSAAPGRRDARRQRGKRPRLGAPGPRP